MSDNDGHVLRRAADLADDALWPAADGVDQGDIPVLKQLDRLAEAGLYGLAVPAADGGLGVSDRTFRQVVEVLGGADLTTTFVWIQHQGVAKRLARSSATDLRNRWLGELASGRVRAGVGVGGVRPPEPTLTARADGDRWILDGTIPWVTGWGLIDVLLVAARVEDDVVWLLMDAPQPTGSVDEEIHLSGPSISATRYDLVALDHSRSAAVALNAHSVPAERLLGRQSPAEWAAADAAGLRTNGSLSLGLATRCVRLMDRSDGPLAEAIDRIRRRLEEAAVDDLPAARANAAQLAWTAAGALLVSRGGRSVAMRDPGQRLAREAMVLQVFGTRPEITAALLQRSSAAVRDL